MKIKLFTHTDLDGFGSYFLACICYGSKNVDVEYCGYNDVNEKVISYLKNESLSFDRCYITDISVNEETAHIIEHNFKDRIRLFDHHPTALELDKYDWCKVIEYEQNGLTKTSGTKLFYDYLKIVGYFSNVSKINKCIKDIVINIRDYDTWKWKSDNNTLPKKVNDLFYLYGRDEFFNWCYNQICDNSYIILTESDNLLLSIKQREIDEYIDKKSKRITVKEINGFKVGIVFAENHQSELGNRLSEMHPELDLIAMVNLDTMHVGYRTIRDDIDTGRDFATMYKNGGGHPKSSGSLIEDSVKDEVIKLVFEGDKYDIK